MECEAVRAHLADHLESAPSTVDAEVEAHLRTCRACALELDGLRETWSLLGAVQPDRPDSAAMRARLDAGIAEYRTGESEGPAGRMQRQPFRRTWFPPVVQLALAAATLVLGVLLGRLTTAPPRTDPQIAALREEVRDMRQMVTLSLMQQESASDRLKGVTWTGRLEQPGGEVIAALLDALAHDPDANVRLAAVDALRRFGDRERVRSGAVDALSRQTSPLVQIALIDFLVESSGRESAPAFRRLSQDPVIDPTVRERATWALQQVS